MTSYKNLLIRGGEIPFAIFCFIFVLLGFAAVSQGSADEWHGDMTVEGEERSYTVFIPDKVSQRREPAPTVFVLHGGFGSGDRVRRYLSLDRVAEREGFVVVYPDGMEGGWNDGRETMIRKRFHGDPPDDVLFLTRLADSLIARRIADPQRIYVTGVSNGGMMTFRLACEASNVFAAFAPVIANMPEILVRDCEPERGVPILVINGTDDPLMPYDGGAIRFLGQRGGWVISTAETMAFWRRNNRCFERPETRSLPDRDRSDGSRVVMDYNVRCDSGAPVILLSVEGGGHRVPGAARGRGFLGRAILGRQNNDISAAEVIWRFFAGWDRSDTASP